MNGSETLGDAWRVADTAALYALKITPLDVGKFAFVLTGGARYQATSTGTGSACWNRVDAAASPIFDLSSGDFGPIYTDGTNATANTTAMKAARDKAVAAGRGIIRLPPAASFAFEEGMGNMLGAIIWEGAGIAATRLDFKPSSGHADDLLFGFGTNSPWSEASTFGPGMRQLYINAASAAAINGNPTVVQLDSTHYAFLDHIRINGFDGGTSWKFVMKNAAQHTRLNQVQIVSCSQGWLCLDANTITATHLSLDSQGATTGPGFKLVNCINLNWQGGMLQGNINPAMLIQPTTGGACDSITMQEIYCECFSGSTSGTVLKVDGTAGSVQGLKLIGGLWSAGHETNVLFDFDHVFDFEISGYRLYYGASLTVLKARTCTGLVAGMIAEQLAAADANLIVDINSTNKIRWMTSVGITAGGAGPALLAPRAGFAAGDDYTIRFPYTAQTSDVSAYGTPVRGDTVYLGNGPGLWTYGAFGWGPTSKRKLRATTTDISTSGTHTTPVSFLSAAVAKDAFYLLRVFIPYTTTDTSTGLNVKVLFPANTSFRLYYTSVINGAYPYVASAYNMGASTAVIGPASGAGAGPGSSGGVAVLEGQVQCPAAGTLTVQFASSDAAKAVTVRDGCYFEITERDY
jgi:hypothetical protein